MMIRTPPVARRARARERSKRDILLSAAEVFARRGFASATLAELAEAAGYAPASLYRYFSSKEEIFRSLLRLVEEEFTATFEAPVDAAAPLARRIEALLRAQHALATSRRVVFDLLVEGPAAEDGRVLHDASAGIVRYTGLLLGWLRRHARAKELRCSPEDAARALAGIAFCFHQHARVSGADGPERAALIADLALHGLAAPPPRRGTHP
jgi:AcrR family transcriptional regulator